MYQDIEHEGKKKKVMSVGQAATRLACVKSTVRKYLRNNILTGIQIFDEEINRYRQFVFFDSVYNFVTPKRGRSKGSKDKTIDRSKRQKAARENGRLGGLANKGSTKTRPNRISEPHIKTDKID